jgi:signal transduction histidine kinase
MMKWNFSPNAAGYRTSLEQALREQQELNQQLQRANQHLALLSEVNRHIAESATLDEILDAALLFPQRLVPARAAALLLHDGAVAIETRTEGVDSDELVQLRRAFGVQQAGHGTEIQQFIAPATPIDNVAACVVLPLHDGGAAIGWIELYLERTVELANDEHGLLSTIASELAEAITSARRRSREERAIYELERAIAEERARIARDIHDGLAQTLAFRRMRIDLWLDWLDTDRERLRDELIGMKDILRDQIQELRRAIFALRPVQFDELGFVGGLHRYIVEYGSQQDWNVHVDLHAAPSVLPPQIEAVCFRVVQEALTNVAKHAGASDVEVVIGQADHGLHVVVRDNGRGFEPGRIADPALGHVGLRQMQERLATVYGQLTVLSQPGAGTELRVWIPLDSMNARRGA